MRIYAVDYVEVRNPLPKGRFSNTAVEVSVFGSQDDQAIPLLANYGECKNIVKAFLGLDKLINESEKFAVYGEYFINECKWNKEHTSLYFHVAEVKVR